MAEVGQNCPRHDLDTLVEVGVLHSAIVFDNFQIMEDTLGHLWEEGRHNKDIFDSVSLQPSDERFNSVQAHLNEYECLSSHFPA